MLIEKLLGIIEDTLPAKTAMEGDRIGLQIQSGLREVSKILVTMEVNEGVIEEAASMEADCIITFHPLIFAPLKSIRESDRVGRLTTKLISNSICLICAHTNFDAFYEGTSKILADKLGLHVDGFLEPDKLIDNYGMGVIAYPDNAMSGKELLERVNSICHSPLKYCEGRNDEIKKIAIVGGSGSSFMRSVYRSRVNAFITADMTYHKFHDARGRVMIIDPGHYEMEQYVPIGLYNLLKEKLDENDYDNINVSKVHTNPVRYFPDDKEYEIKQKEYLINN